jgi:rSAM/selenodomain-associated transferase 1
VSLETVAVIVMAKVPEAGRVKTRLLPALSPEHAARVHQVFVQHVMSRLHKLGPPELVMCFDPPQLGRQMYQLVGPRATRYVAQSPGDLGARMDAVAREIGKWYGKILFLGVDSPDVPIGHLTRAAEMLNTNEVVVGPCGDGGFWCLGVQRMVNLNMLFDGIEWSSGKEREQTIENAQDLECSCAAADAWDDVDHPEDLQKLLARLSASNEEDDRKLLAALSFLPQGVTS